MTWQSFFLGLVKTGFNNPRKVSINLTIDVKQPSLRVVNLFLGLSKWYLNCESISCHKIFEKHITTWPSPCKIFKLPLYAKCNAKVGRYLTLCPTHYGHWERHVNKGRYLTNILQPLRKTSHSFQIEVMPVLGIN